MARRAARRLRVLLGRRGAFLLILGIGKTCWGVGFLVDPPAPAGLRLLTELCDIQDWAWLWIAAGLVTTFSAFMRVGRDWAGFVAALVPPTVWAIAYTAAVVSGEYSRGAYVAIWYLTSHVGVILWASRVPEHSVPHVSRAAREGGPG
ncbi:hypothetical protein [Streptomyces sp. A012304]|uniref:hypothetical protein n=1 Tax=Streptomyces sp. A012304 TaxID=375446 RepID=UPI002230131C|nr:hypothetical protein [Streptomyces sp. A012304]GKQ34603.1 hypothetical protein ALMP_11520 [Streptomyces sp. A012304]